MRNIDTLLLSPLLQIHREADHLISETVNQLSANISCRKGCSGCCTLPVTVRVSEALQIFRNLENLSIDLFDRVLCRMDHVVSYIDFSSQFFYHYRQMVGPCPFLSSEGRCTCYADRPLTCRGVISDLSPKYCEWNYLESASVSDQQTMYTALASKSRELPYIDVHTDVLARLDERIEANEKTHLGYTFSATLPILFHLFLVTDYLSSGFKSDRINRYAERFSKFPDFLVSVSP